MSQQPDAGPDDVPAEVGDWVDPAAVEVTPTPLDEDTSAPDDPDALAELIAALGGQ
jgi:hypothetical protein